MTVANVEAVVKERYRRGAREPVAELCCPVDYDPRYLEAIPREVLERDYGCGDPSRHLQPGETVLDLGSGTGKICFIASQVVGAEGRVIGVDMTDDMLAVARRAAPAVAARLGYANVEFRRGRIQDLALDLDLLDRRLAERPVADDDKRRLFAEIFRVLRRGGRAVISDIVSDEPVTEAMRADPELWSGCISGALTEDGFLAAFEEAGFHGVQVLELQAEPWRTVEGIEFRSVTVEAFKGKQGPCWERNQAVIYKGPFKEVLDDDGHRMERGRRYAVCDKTFRLYAQEPYREHFHLVEPREEVPLADARAFDCAGTRLRHPRETKGLDYDATTEAAGPCCGPDGCC